MKTWKSKITEKVWTEEELQEWIRDFYVPLEVNIPGFKRPEDALERTVRVLQLERQNSVSGTQK